MRSGLWLLVIFLGCAAHTVLPEKLSITYKDATGPLEMTLEAVRRTGIDIGIDHAADGRVVYEFKIAFKAEPSLEGLGPDMMVGVGIQDGPSGKARSRKIPPGGKMERPGPGAPRGGQAPGGMGAGRRWGAVPAVSRSAGKGEAVECWLAVQLAGQGQG